MPHDPKSVIDDVKARYGRIAAGGGGCCGPGGCGDGVAFVDSLRLGYAAADLELLPDGADLGLGCGAPLYALDPRPGETILDLGSGAGIDVFLAAARVGPEGRAIGVDMTPEMVDAAARHARSRRLANVEFRLGRLESLPVEDASVDAVTSNCVINLVPDKGAVFREIARVLKPGGRLVISDVVLERDLPASVKADVLAYVGCVAGAMVRPEYFEMVRRAGLERVEILKDADFLHIEGDAAVDRLRELAAQAGERFEDYQGVARSVTWRAWR